jgi:hypothetical protein
VEAAGASQPGMPRTGAPGAGNGWAEAMKDLLLGIVALALLLGGLNMARRRTD